MRSTALRTLVLIAAAFGASQVAAQQAAGTSRYQEGKHYTALSSPQPTSTDAGKIEVAEVFMFSCPACFAFEPHIQGWLKRKADYVNFVRIPAALEPAGATARARLLHGGSAR